MGTQQAEPLVSQQDRPGPQHQAQLWEGLVRIVPFVRDFPENPAKVISQNCSQSPISLIAQPKGYCFLPCQNSTLNIPLSSHLRAKSNQLSRHFASSSAIPGPGACPPAQDSRCEELQGPCLVPSMWQAALQVSLHICAQTPAMPSPFDTPTPQYSALVYKKQSLSFPPQSKVKHVFQKLYWKSSQSPAKPRSVREHSSFTAPCQFNDYFRAASAHFIEAKLSSKLGITNWWLRALVARTEPTQELPTKPEAILHTALRKGTRFSRRNTLLGEH